MTNNIQLIEILKELVEKSKDYNDGFMTPKEYEIQISELDNYDFLIFEELEKTERKLWTKTGSGIEKPLIAYVPTLKIKNDYVSFIPTIIREYLKEIEE
ncbi:MAG: hypothetical protein COB73_09850 [Flavobacteriaceae bacterium]|nr:MAG: hypothetical protein COB73_09850 [Flavobacteriaceae bacterium]